MKNYKVSILIPVYNVSDFILRCMESVSLQTYDGELECILVDDCGSDNSIELARKFIESYQGKVFFQIVHHEHNRGLAAARNTAVANAKGDFVFHLDSDDWLEPTAIDQLVLKQQETGADIVSGQALKHSQNGTSILKDPDYKTPDEMVKCMIEMTIVHVIWRRLIRRSLYVDNNIKTVEGVNVGEDYLTIPRLAYYAKNVATIDEVVYHYNCLNTNSYMAMGFNINRFRSDLRSIETLQDFFSDKDVYCVNRLNEIKRDFLKSWMKFAAVTDNIIAYNEIKSYAGNDSQDLECWKKVWIIRMKNKMKKNVKKNLHWRKNEKF